MANLPLSIKLKRFAYQLHKKWTKFAGTSGQIYFEDRVRQYHKIWEHIARELNANFSVLDDDLWEIESNNKKVRLLNYKLPLDNPVVLGLAGRKPVIHKLLTTNNIPVPAFTTFSLKNLNKAYAFLDKYPLACVVKPAGGYGGKGVTTHIKSRNQLKEAAILASLQSNKLLIEQQIAGECYRLLIYKGKFLHAVKRNGYKIKGDGLSSIKQLTSNDGTFLNDIDCMFTLAAQDITLDTVPDKNQLVLIKSIGKQDQNTVELRTVYDEDVTAIVCAEIVKDAEHAANITGSSLLGVDIITTDITRDLRITGGTVNEVNTTPALHHHYNSQVEAYPQSALYIIRDLLTNN